MGTDEVLRLRFLEQRYGEVCALMGDMESAHH